MSTIRTAAEDYLRLRRALGFKLTNQGRLLLDFVGFLESTGQSRFTIAAALTWANRPAGADPTWTHGRLGVVRGFAVYLQTLDPTTQVPAANLLPDSNHRAVPFIFTAEEITLVLGATSSLGSPHRVATHRTLFGVLAVTGMRIGEAVGLDRGDVDLDQELLTVTRTKFTGSRRLPLHSTTMAALADYARRRDTQGPAPRAVSFFTSSTGTRLIASNASKVFAGVSRQAGLRPRSARCRPRAHDLRHSFAVNTLLDWYRDGVDVGSRLPLLSAYLGHTNPAATYWYLTGTPELLSLAAARLETPVEP